jgi:hypothetical protein
MKLNELMNENVLSGTSGQSNDPSQRLFKQIEHLSTLCQALYECLSDAGIEQNIITQKLSEINERNNQTGPATIGFLTECHSCGKLVSSRHSYCTFCGARLSKNFIL